MRSKEKLGDRGGVLQWRKLETAGDIRRLVAWAAHSLRNGTMDRADAIVFGQLGAVLLKCVQESTVEDRLSEIEASLDTLTDTEQPDSPTQH